jgi:hypothetical protein
VPQPAAALLLAVALPWWPPLRGDVQLEGTATRCAAESTAGRAAVATADAPGGACIAAWRRTAADI